MKNKSFVRSNNKEVLPAWHENYLNYLKFYVPRLTIGDTMCSDDYTVLLTYAPQKSKNGVVFIYSFFQNNKLLFFRQKPHVIIKKIMEIPHSPLRKIPQGNPGNIMGYSFQYDFPVATIDIDEDIPAKVVYRPVTNQNDLRSIFSKIFPFVSASKITR